jgi:hypothetical protein
MRITVGLFLILTFLVSLRDCDGDPRRKIVFIFCDVTNSLDKSESEKVASMAAGILNSLPAGTEYRLYPILVETDRLTPINDKESLIRPKESDPNLQGGLEKRRQEELTEKLRNLYQITNKNRFDNRTCILNALSFAGNQLNDFPKDKYDRELVIISDMFEECNDTPLKRKIDIRKPDINEELKLAESSPQMADLSSVVVTIITPATEDTYMNYEPGTKPPMSSLKDFWGKIFTHCNVPPEAQKDPEKYFWSNGILPRRFLVQSKPR